MRVIRFFLGPQHAIICIPAVALYSLGLLLYMFGYGSPADWFDISRYIGALYLVSLILSVTQRKA